MSDAVWRVRGSPLVAGRSHGPLSGVRVAVKDLFAVQGFAMGAGCPAWLREAAPEPSSAHAVQAPARCWRGRRRDRADRRAGLRVGREERALRDIHQTRLRPATSPGGSSSGPGSAVAQGDADIGLGTDTAGSIRVPGSYLGLFGMRPTHNAVSTRGMLALAPSFDTVGWLARDAATLAAVGDVLLPRAQEMPVRRALLVGDLLELAVPAAAAACRIDAARGCSAAEVSVREVTSVSDGQVEEWFTAFRTVQLGQIEDGLGAWVRQHPAALSSDVAARFAAAADVTPAQRHAARAILVGARELLSSLLQDGTVLLLPTTHSSAPGLGQTAEQEAATRAGNLRLNCIAALGGLPAITIPMQVAGHPVGLSAVGGRGADRSLLALADALSYRPSVPPDPP